MMDMDETEKVTSAYGSVGNLVYGGNKAAAQTYSAANLFASNNVKI